METNLLTDHSYDGIEEFDNPLPSWWRLLFLATIFFSVGYVLWFHTGAPDRTLEAYYQSESSAVAKMSMGDIKLDGDDATLVKYANDPKVSIGEGVFKSHCTTCHGRKGEGVVGPNLTDEFYKYIRKPEDIYAIIDKGAGNGAMPAWGNRLDKNEIVLVSSYVMTLRGKNVEGKAADGQQIAPWPALPPAETKTEKTK